MLTALPLRAFWRCIVIYQALTVMCAIRIYAHTIMSMWYIVLKW